MEINSNKSNNDATKTAGKMVNNSTKEIMDYYTNQFNVATEYYKKMFNAFSPENTDWKTTPNFYNIFFSNDVTKTFATPFSNMSNNFTKSFVPSYDNMFKLLFDNNTTQFSILNNGIKDNTDFAEISKKYHDYFNTNLETSKNILKNNTEAYNRQLNLFAENNKKTIDEMNNQLCVMAKENQKFWTDLMTQTTATSVNNEKTATDVMTHEIKKKSGILINEFSDHKI